VGGEGEGVVVEGEEDHQEDVLVISIIREGGGYRSCCPRCQWNRHFEKVQSAFTRLSEHLHSVHRVRAEFEVGVVEVIQREMEEEEEKGRGEKGRGRRR
jgi:hypothetical protein